MVLASGLLSEVRTEVKDVLENLLTHGAIGEDNTAASSSDTDLGLEVFRDTIDEVDKSVGDKITVSFRIETTEANGNTIREGALLSGGSLSIDNCDTADWTDSADMTTSLNTTTYKENEKSLDLTKDAGASATASTYKATTSRDFTDKKLSVWVYIIDTTALNKLATSNCFTIRLGSGSSNYYEWEKNKSDLAVGWNLIKNLTSSNADSTTGSPVITGCNYTYIGLTADASTTTWSAGDFIMDDIKLVSGTLYMRNVLTEINKTDDIQLFLDFTTTITVTEA